MKLFIPILCSLLLFCLSSPVKANAAADPWQMIFYYNAYLMEGEQSASGWETTEIGPKCPGTRTAPADFGSFVTNTLSFPAWKFWTDNYEHQFTGLREAPNGDAFAELWRDFNAAGRTRFGTNGWSTQTNPAWLLRAYASNPLKEKIYTEQLEVFRSIIRQARANARTPEKLLLSTRRVELLADNAADIMDVRRIYNMPHLIPRVQQFLDSKQTGINVRTRSETAPNGVRFNAIDWHQTMSGTTDELRKGLQKNFFTDVRDLEGSHVTVINVFKNINNNLRYSYGC